jgi:hypothetical protein
VKIGQLALINDVLADGRMELRSSKGRATITSRSNKTRLKKDWFIFTNEHNLRNSGCHNVSTFQQGKKK